MRPFGNIEHFLKPTNISLKTTIFSTQSHRSFTGSIQELFLFGTPVKNSNPAKMILSVMGSQNYCLLVGIVYIHCTCHVEIAEIPQCIAPTVFLFTEWVEILSELTSPFSCTLVLLYCSGNWTETAMARCNMVELVVSKIQEQSFMDGLLL